MKMQEPLHNDLPGHCAYRRRGKAGSQQGYSKNDARRRTEKRLESPIGLFQRANIRPGSEKSRSGGNQHGSVH